MSEIAVLASGSGTNAENIIRYFPGEKSFELVWLLVLTNRQNAVCFRCVHAAGSALFLYFPMQHERGKIPRTHADQPPVCLCTPG